MNDLHRKYRPQELKDVLGQDSTVKSLTTAFKSKKVPHALLFTGSSGIGKTTLARIVAKKLGCKKVMEYDMARFSTVDSMRELIKSLKYKSFEGKGIKFIIFDECHRASKHAFDAILKTLEEPEDHVYFALCTTEASKVPKTIKTRCINYNLKDVDHELIMDLLTDVSFKEDLKFDNNIIDLIAESAKNSPRMALTNLQKCIGCKTEEEIIEVLESIKDKKEVIELCRSLIKNPNWFEIQRILPKLKEYNSESIRIQIVNYFSAAILKTKKPEKADKLMQIMDPFLEPIYAPTGLAQIISAIGEACFGKEI